MKGGSLGPPFFVVPLRQGALQPRPADNNGCSRSFPHQAPDQLAAAQRRSESMRMMIMALAAAATVGTAIPATAQMVNQREVRQHQRIRQGVRTGQLSRAEAQRLRYLEARLRRTEARLRWRHGGRLTVQDRQRLQAMERRDSAEIYRLKHNRQYRR
jgi:hypothetical protein